MHDLRNLGYKRLRASDPKEDALRTKWYETRDAWVADGSSDSGQAHHAFFHVDHQLSSYLWEKALGEREADRKAHPKAKRNLPVPPRDPDAEHPSRLLP